MRLTDLALGAFVLSAVATAPSQEPPVGARPTAQILPAAVNTLLSDPVPYVGDTVSVTAAVDRVSSPTSFAIRQEPGKVSLLVIAPTLNATPPIGQYVTVLGTFIRFSAAELARRAHGYAIDVPSDEVSDGVPVILATSVLTPQMIDIARRLLPRLSPDEQAYQQSMKRIGPAFTALRSAIEASDPTAGGEQIAALRGAFAEIAPFWAAHGRADAIQWTADARKETDATGISVVKGEWDPARAASARLGQTCQSCHAVYRDRLDDGTYTFKGLSAK